MVQVQIRMRHACLTFRVKMVILSMEMARQIQHVLRTNIQSRLMQMVERVILMQLNVYLIVENALCRQIRLNGRDTVQMLNGVIRIIRNAMMQMLLLQRIFRHWVQM